MQRSASLLLNLVASIEVALVALLISEVASIEPSMVALVLACLWISIFHSVVIAVVALAIPYMIGVFVTIYQTTLDFDFSLVARLLFEGDRSIANSASLNVFAYSYSPIMIMGLSLNSRLGIIDDLCRYKMWNIQWVRTAVEALMRVLALVDAASEYLYKVQLGLRSRYLDLRSTGAKLRHLKLWAPPLFLRIILSEFQRFEYLQSTGIALRKVSKQCARGLILIELFALFILFATVVLCFSILMN